MPAVHCQGQFVSVGLIVRTFDVRTWFVAPSALLPSLVNLSLFEEIFWMGWKMDFFRSDKRTSRRSQNESSDGIILSPGRSRMVQRCKDTRAAMLVVSSSGRVTDVMSLEVLSSNPLFCFSTFLSSRNSGIATAEYSFKNFFFTLFSTYTLILT